MWRARAWRGRTFGAALRAPDEARIDVEADAGCAGLGCRDHHPAVAAPQVEQGVPPLVDPGQR
jgi:hypothetical protein